ncbi:MAG TPA: helix-turn-helix transcriptional regulator [Azospirillum sp.]|nr:helix-turn-helix transcriptional regulator [Azospirillum sp.]
MRASNDPAYLMIGMAVGERVKQARTTLQLTQKELARRLSLSQSYLSEVENGKGKANIDLLVGLAVHFPELNPRWLLTGIGSMMPAQEEKNEVGDVFLDFDALLTAELILTKALNEPDNNFNVTTVAYFVRLMYKTYMTHLKSLMSQGVPEDQARTLARAECEQLDRREIEAETKPARR